MARFSKTYPGVANYYFYYYNEGKRQEATSPQVAESFKKALVWASIAAGTIVVATLAEDIMTWGAGIADDVASLVAAAALGRAILAY